ncbi:DUF6876 family protein [Yeosuana marina]|uniref:DUF6876 family protein n=1 Tax=Yeosuana marina TaxID=1565536 RepID=UPI0030C7EC7F
MKRENSTLQENLQQFIGSERFFQLPLIKTRFTDGIHYLAEQAACFWLVTDASVIAKSLMDRSHFITIDFKRLPEKEREEKQCEALIHYSDGNGHIYETHRYHVTDFPMDELRLFFVNGTLMLPSEY